MNLMIFSTLFIAQLVGHLVGDYVLQGEQDALKKSMSLAHRFRHCVMYSIAVTLSTMTIMWEHLPYEAFVFILVVTFIEHMIVDSRKPVTGWKTFFEHKIMRNEKFDIQNLPFFVLIEIDQTFHYVRIFVISAIIAYTI